MMLRNLVGYAAMALAVVCGAGSLAVFAAVPLGSVRLPVNWPEPLVLAWDALLSFTFFLQHSGMVRRRFRARLSVAIPPPYHRACYSIASGVALVVVVLLWQPSTIRLITLEGAYLWAARGAALLAIWVFIWGAVAVRDLDFFGLASIRAHLRHSPAGEPVFVVRGPYRWMRHPWYFAVIVLIWSFPEWTADRLLFNVLWTGWICVGARLEEADLTAEFGDAYTEYRRKVPMLIPWRGPAGGNS
jgi:methanethiol S-methyltransferase